MSEERAPMNAVISKIQKLFALGQAGKNNSEAEAAAALAKAQELLLRYNLDLKTVQDTVAAAGGAGLSITEEAARREKTTIKRSAMYNWQQDLCRTVAECNLCWHWVQRVRVDRAYVKRHVILGSAVNVTAATLMYEYLCDTLERILPYPQKERLSKDAVSWREGAAERLGERLREGQRINREWGAARSEEGAACTALAVIDLERREEAINYEARWGAGSWTAKQQREAEEKARKESPEYKAEQEAQRQRWVEEERLEREKEAAKLAAETPRQREKREERERRAQEREQARWWRRYNAADARRDSRAFREGAGAAETINLSAQLRAERDETKLKGA